MVQRGVLWDTVEGAGGTLEVVGWGLSELFGAALNVSPRWDTNNPCVQLHFTPGLRKKALASKNARIWFKIWRFVKLSLSFNVLANFNWIWCFKHSVFQYCHSNHWGSWGRPRVPPLRGRVDSRKLASRLCELLLGPKSMRSWLLGGQSVQWAYQAWKEGWRLVTDSLLCWQHKVVLVVSQVLSELLVVLKMPGTGVQLGLQSR